MENYQRLSELFLPRRGCILLYIVIFKIIHICEKLLNATWIYDEIAQRVLFLVDDRVRGDEAAILNARCAGSH